MPALCAPKAALPPALCPRRAALPASADAAMALPQDAGATTPKGDGPTRDESFLDDLAQRLKLVKEGAFNALKPMESLRKFLNRNTGNTENNYLEKQDGAIKQIEAAAKNAEALKKIEKATASKTSNFFDSCETFVDIFSLIGVYSIQFC